MTYSGSPNPDPGEVKRDEETLQRQRDEKAEQDRLEEERRILEQEVPFWRRQKQLEGDEFTPDPEGPHYQSIAAETGIGIAADFFLPSPDPLSRAASFGVGYGANALAQWMRGDWDDFSHGEAVAAGGFQAIPFGTAAKGLKGLKRATAKGALGGVTMAQLEVGIDEQRRLTTRELMLSGVLGGTVAGGFKAAELGGDALPSAIMNNLPAKAVHADSSGVGFGPFGKHLKSMSLRGRPRKPFKNRLLGERILDSSSDGTLTQKIEHALKIDKSRGFKARIPKKALDKGKSQVDEAAAIDKDLIRKFIKPYQHTEADVLDIYNKTKKGFKDYSDTRTWLNKYFDELSKGLEDISAAKPGDPPLLLKDVEINTVKNDAGELEPRLVVKVTGEEVNIDAFHVDHRAAKVKLSKLGIRGADVFENLDIVYGVFNTAKNYAGNPMLPREFHMALGESYGLQEFVQKHMDKEFAKKFNHIPAEVREQVRESMIQDLLESKGTQKDIKRIVDQQIYIWSNPDGLNRFSEFMISVIQAIPRRIYLDESADRMTIANNLLRKIKLFKSKDGTLILNHQVRLEEIMKKPYWTHLSKAEKQEFIKLSDMFIDRERGLGARTQTKLNNYYGDRLDG